MKTITPIKKMFLMEGEVHTVGIYGFTGLILELEDGRIVTHGSTDPMQQFTELTPNKEQYEQIKLLIQE